MIIKPAVFFLCLCTNAALLVQPVQAQTSNSSVEALPALLSEEDQVNQLLRSTVQLIYDYKTSEATQIAEQALAICQRTGNVALQIKAMNILAFTAARSGRVRDSIRIYEQVATIAGQANNRNTQALALARAGNLLRVSGLYAEALDCLDHAIALYRQEKNLRDEVWASGTLASVYTETGDFDRARQQLQQALALAAEVHDKVLDEALLLKQAIVERESGNIELALKFGLQALTLDEAHDFEATKGKSRRSFEETLETPQQYFALTRQELLLHLGMVYQTLEDHQKMEEFLERALVLAEDRRRPILTAVIIGNVAGARLKLGKAAEARDLAIKAIAMLRDSGGSEHWESIFLYYLAEAQRALGATEDAVVSYHQAIAAIERARSLSIATEISRAGIVAARHEVFAGAIDFFVSQHRDEEALAIAEAWHARAFLDMLTESRIDLAKDLSPAQRKQEDQIFAHISRVQRQLWSSGLAPAREPELKGELATAESALESFELEVRRTNPLYADIKYPQPAKASTIEGELANGDSALIEYVLGDQHSFAFLIYRGRISSFVLPPKKEIEGLITGYCSALSERVSALTVGQSMKKLNARTGQIYQQLFKPMIGQLAGAKRLIIVPDGVLSYLPFETLVEEGAAGSSTTPRYLLETFAISYAPSASALFAIKNRGSAVASGLIALGAPSQASTFPGKVSPGAGSATVSVANLPYTRTEVNDIGSLFDNSDRRLLLGAEASEARFKKEILDRYRYLHFATHGVIDEEHPARSGIVLSAADDTTEDGVLQMSEVMRLKLRADLVTLSACSTGLGKLVNGEGIIGLTRSFLYAGADTVVVSLWDVNDLSTATLMKTFYGNLKQGLPKDEAMRQAKLQMLRGPQHTWRHPYFWAPFVQVGANSGQVR